MIEWRPFSPKALDFIQNSDARLNIAHGAVRSSKTISCTVRWLAYLAGGPEGDLAMLGRTTATLQRNVLNDLFDIVGPKNYKWVNRQQGELRILGRRVYCFGANNEDAESKIRGATFAGALCDEVNLYPQSVFNQLMARLSVEGAKCFCNCNPDSPYHWLYTDYIINDDIRDKKVWKFLMEDNLSLSRSYVNSLKQMYRGVWYQRMILGNWVAAEGRIYDMFDPEQHMQDTSKILQDAYDAGLSSKAVRWLVGCDYGTSTVMSWGLYARIPAGLFHKSSDGKPLMLKCSEFYYDAKKRNHQQTDQEFLSDFYEWLNQCHTKFETDACMHPWAVYCDPSAASWKVALMRAGYRVLNANNDVINGIRHVATCLTSGDFIMDKSCVNTEKEYASYVWDENAQRQGVDKPVKEHDHTCDTDRYVLYTDSLGGLSGVYS